jgi:hypothetical protein
MGKTPLFILLLLVALAIALVTPVSGANATVNDPVVIVDNYQGYVQFEFWLYLSILMWIFFFCSIFILESSDMTGGMAFLLSCFLIFIAFGINFNTIEVLPVSGDIIVQPVQHITRNVFIIGFQFIMFGICLINFIRLAFREYWERRRKHPYAD